jgi:hypothetical protein
MARTKADAAVVRPRCPEHPTNRVWLDGFEPCRWSDAHRRPRYRCVTPEGTKGHAFSLPVAVRQPTERHPDSGVACPSCEHVYGRHEGVRTGRDCVFGHREIARLLLRIGEGMSLRQASADLREDVFRSHDGVTSRQANLAVDYLDAFAPEIVAALHPTRWPRVVVIDARTLFTRGDRAARRRETDDPPEEAWVGELKAGTILVALDGTARRAVPCLMRVAGAKDAENWATFFASLAGAPEVVVADLDPAIARAERETWPDALLLPSRHHLAALMHERAVADGVPERVRLQAPVALTRPLPWTGEPTKRWGEHPLHAAMLPALRGPVGWAAFLALVERHVPADKLALRGWIASHELLVRRAWTITAQRRDLPLSTGALEGSIGEWLAPIVRRAGRWQNARRLDLVLALMTLRARGEAREARYARILRAVFAAHGNHAHPPDERPATERWRTFRDHGEASLPRLVREADRRWRRRADDDAAARARERSAARYAAEIDLRERLGLPRPPTGRARRPSPHTGSVQGRHVADFAELLAEWAWDVNGGLDPSRLAAGSHARVAWRCLLEPAHVWEARVSDRTGRGSACPYHMGIRVHPAESLAAYFPWLALEGHPTRNTLRPDQVSRASAREVVWRCEQGHEWSAAVYQRTLSRTGCPECHRLEAGARSRAGKERARRMREEAPSSKVIPFGVIVRASDAS